MGEPILKDGYSRVEGAQMRGSKTIKDLYPELYRIIKKYESVSENNYSFTETSKLFYKERKLKTVEYDKLPVILQRYSFQAKMKICQQFSIRAIQPSGLKKAEQLINYPLPWEIETFLLFSIKSKEYSNNNFEGKNINKFLQMIECIKAYIPSKMMGCINETKLADYILMVLGLTQFELQEFYIYKYYRYFYIFNFKNQKIDMPDLFSRHFKTNYDDFLVFGFVLRLLFSLGINIPPNVLNYYAVTHSAAMNNLKISRDEYAKQIDRYSSTVDDYLYCVRPSYSFPFIEYEDNIYLPLPHSIDRSITASLLYRMTEGNDPLRTLIGKEVLEKYLYEIIFESDLFDEVIPEQTYILGKTERKTLDVMTRKINDYLFFDSKLLTPKSKIRQLDDAIIDDQIERLSSCIEQIFKHLKHRFTHEYYCICEPKSIIDKEQMWGMAVVLEDPYIRPELIYCRAARNLKVDINSAEFKWMESHIKLVSLYDIEKFVFTGESILDHMKQQKASGRNFDFSLGGDRQNSKITNKKVLQFKSRIIDIIGNEANELQKIGLIQ